MDTSLNVIVIGASPGIGLELVRQYRGQGASVVATARDAAALARLQALGARALRLDVADAVSASSLAWQIDGERFDHLILNAGVIGPACDGLDLPTQAEFDAVMHTNVLGVMRVLPQLAEVLAPGARLVVMSSRMGAIGQRSHADQWLYRVSKAALNSVLKDAAITLAGRALCAALHPGWVRTDMGGLEADLSVEESARALRANIAGLTDRQHGAFLDIDGQPLAW
jgi:NAD(P)-dependent dehydrogenase (short-subunit alcohol dehydrogenase family)